MECGDKWQSQNSEFIKRELLIPSKFVPRLGVTLLFNYFRGHKPQLILLTEIKWDILLEIKLGRRMRWAHLKKLILWPLKSYFFKAFWPLLVLFKVRNSRFFCPVLDENFQVSRAVIPFKQIFFFFFGLVQIFWGKEGNGKRPLLPKGFQNSLKKSNCPWKVLWRSSFGAAWGRFLSDFSFSPTHPSGEFLEIYQF